MKGFFVVLLFVAAGAGLVIKSEEIMLWLAGEREPPASKRFEFDPDSPFNPPRFKPLPRPEQPGLFPLRQKFKAPVALSEVEYLARGFPAVGSPWGMSAIQQFADAAAELGRTMPESLPGSNSDYGKGAFGQIKTMTERASSVSPEAMIEFGEAYKIAFDAYHRAGMQDYQYDKELALMACVTTRFCTEVLRSMDEEADRIGRTLVTPEMNARDPLWKTRYHRSFSAVKELSRGIFDALLVAIEDRAFFRPESRRLMASYLLHWYPDAGPILKLNYKARIKSIGEREDDPEASKLLGELVAKL